MKKLAIFISIILIFGNLLSNEISLNEAISKAMEHNKALLSVKNDLQAKKWRKYNSLTNFLPQINFNSTMVHIDDDTYESSQQILEVPVFDGTSNLPNGDYIPFSSGAMGGMIYQTSFQNNINIIQPIFNGGKIWLGYQISELGEQLSGLLLEDKINEVKYQVASAHYDLLQLATLIDVQNSNISAIEEHQRVAQNHFENGIALQSEVLRWKVELSKAAIELNNLKNGYQIAKENWLNLTGYTISDNPLEIDLTGYDDEISKLDLENSSALLVEYLKSVKDNNPILKTIMLTNKLAQKQKDFSLTEFLPNLNMQYTYTIENDDKFDFDGEDNWNLAALLSMPLFSGGKNFTNLKKANFELRKQEYSNQDLQEKLILGAKNCYLNYLNSVENVRKSKESLSLVKENHKIISELYEQGMILGADLKDAETMLKAGMMEFTTAYYQYLKLSYETDKWSNR